MPKKIKLDLDAIDNELSGLADKLYIDFVDGTREELLALINEEVGKLKKQAEGQCDGCGEELDDAFCTTCLLSGEHTKKIEGSVVRHNSILRKALATERTRRELVENALKDLYAEVEMAESVGICLPDRVASLNAAKVLAKQ